MSEIIGMVTKYGLQALSVVAVLVVAYLALAGGKASTESSNIATLYSNTNKLYLLGASTAGLTNETVLNAQTEPSSMDVGGQLVNPWGGPITIAGDGTNPTGIDITDTEVPQNACTAEATSVANVTSVSVNGGGVLPQPLNPSTIAQECTSATNTIEFVFTN